MITVKVEGTILQVLVTEKVKVCFFLMQSVMDKIIAGRSWVIRLLNDMFHTGL